MYHKHLPVKLSTYFKKIYVKWSAVGAVTLLIYFLAVRHIPLDGWIGFVLKACIVAITYLAMFVLLHVRKSTLTKLRGRLKH